MTIEIVVLILQILILLAILALKSYATEKGKNQATKEDIGEITREVESAKIDFSAQIEKLKADLNADIQRQLSLFGKRNEALTQFFEDASTVLSLLRTGFHFDYEDLEGLDSHIRRGQESIVRAITSYHRLTVYVREEDITNASYNAATALGILHRNWFGLMLAYRDAFVTEAEEWERAEKTGDFSLFPQNSNDRPSGKAFKNLWQNIGGTVNNLEASLKEYAKSLYTHFHPTDDSKALAAATGDDPDKRIEK